MDPFESKPFKWCDALARTPLDAGLHLRFAQHAAQTGRPFLAYAQLRTAEWLGADPGFIAEYLEPWRGALPELTRMNHNQYFRFRTLADAIAVRSEVGSGSVLDVGGGQGELAAFLPDRAYCLAEPTVNGISGIDLPFGEGAFDWVVACHVLEHIPPPDRDVFLDQLLSKSRRGVVLLNPFETDNNHADELHDLVIEVTGAQWAVEHRACGLPRVSDLTDYADRRGVSIHVTPNGNAAASLASVFVDHFSQAAGQMADAEKVNHFLNTRYTPFLDSDKFPNAYVVVLSPVTGC